MECQVCTLDPVIKAFEEIMRKYSVSAKDRTNTDAKTSTAQTVTRELNPIDAKLARELSKKKPKEEVIEPLQQISERYKDLEELAEEQHDIAKNMCMHCVQAADHQSYSLSCEIAKDYMNIVSSLRSLKGKMAQLMSSKKSTLKKINKLKSLAKNQKDMIDLIKELLPYFQQICKGCSKTSNDDNLSNHGQTFVSIDAMASVGLTSSSKDPAAGIDGEDEENEKQNIGSMTLNDEDNDESSTDAAYRAYYSDNDNSYKTSQSAHDYLMSNAVPTVHEQDPEGNSTLPSHIEDMLRRELAAFAELDVFEQILCFSQWGGQSFSEFGTMKWVPKEILSPQSKQFVCQRWNKVIEKFPIAAALQKSKPIKSVSSALTKHYAEEAYITQKFFFDDKQAMKEDAGDTKKKTSKKIF